MDFLRSIKSKQALEIILGFTWNPEIEIVGIDDGLNRVLAEDIISEEDIPPFSRSLVDGFAVKVRDTYGARETNPSFVNIKGEVKIGETTHLEIGDGESVRVSTGSMIPKGADGVVMQEYVRYLLDSIEITKTIHKGENICFQGDDFKKGDKILEKGKRLNYFDLGVLASIGRSDIKVYKRPTVGIISTGDEIIGINETPKPGQIRDINRYTLSGLFEKEDFTVIHAGIAKDNPEDILNKIKLIGDTDIVLLSGGSSKGDRDYIIESIKRLGGEIFFHGINIKPGKPTIFARLGDKPLFGLPGHPGSCIMVAIRFVLPILKKMEGERIKGTAGMISGTLTANVPSSVGVEECVDVIVERKKDGIFVTPVFAKSSVISSFTKSSGYIIVPEEKEGYERGEEVEVYFF
ncbi:MAG: molybdopterin molybdotransferase MoeA [Syntrophorhabdaceae bacterium]|nr:molybdopterin molybdotransferase MoeA [Syntrophorhabdaceae bacterium]